MLEVTTSKHIKYKVIWVGQKMPFLFLGTSSPTERQIYTAKVKNGAKKTNINKFKLSAVLI